MKFRSSTLPIYAKKYSSLASLTIILTAYFFFGLQHIGSFITADEHYWIEDRIPKYWEAWRDGEPRKTLINDKSGVSLAIVSGPALLFHGETALACQEEDGRFTRCDPEKTSLLYASFRLPILIANALILILIFFSLRAFAGRFVATTATGLMALSPHLLGMSQIVNPDSLLWSTGSAALFGFFAFLKTGKRSFAIWTVIMLTFALLSKYTALILIFFFPIAVLLLHFTEKPFSSLPLKRQLLAIIVFSFVAIALFMVCVPGVLSSEKRLIGFLTAGTGSFFSWIGYGALLGVLLAASNKRFPEKLSRWLGVASGMVLRSATALFLVMVGILVFGRAFFPSWFVFDIVPFDIKDLTNARYTLLRSLSSFEIASLELSPVIYATPFATLLLALFSIGTSLHSPKKNQGRLPLVLLAFILFVMLAVTLANVAAIPRYLILAFPILSLLAALGAKATWKLVPKKFRTAHLAIVLSSALLFSALWSMLASKPYYANFSNALLPEKSLIIDSWGYGGYEAAQYLNSLPDAERLTIWSDYYGVCEFFVGSCLTKYTFEPILAPDYYVLTRRGKIRYMSKWDRWEEKSGLRAYQYYDRADSEFEININGKAENFVKVFKVDNELRASIITDIDHCVSREAAPETALDRFIAFADRPDSDFAISLGDNLSHRLRDCSKHYREDLPVIVEKLNQTVSPNHWVMGDHDIASSKESYDFWLETTGQEDTYYSFDQKNVHIVVLNTITGGEPLGKACADSSSCAEALKEKIRLDTLISSPKAIAAHIEATGQTRADIRKDRAAAVTRYQEELATIRFVRNASNRDRGMVLDRELAWLKQDITDTEKSRVLVFSDHPLFPFVSSKKGYDIKNGDKVRDILEKSGKEVVAISGEAHLWHEEERNGIRYYIVDQFKNANGSWAFFSWNKGGIPVLERITDPDR